MLTFEVLVKHEQMTLYQAEKHLLELLELLPVPLEQLALIQ